MAGSMPLTFVTKISILDFMEVLDMSLIKFYASINIDSVKFYTCHSCYDWKWHFLSKKHYTM